MKSWISAFAFFCLVAMANTAAATTYVYTGPNFTSATGTYTTSMKITGSFTTASPLPANLSNAQIGPGGTNLVTGWSFNDGVQNFTNLNSEVLYGNPTHFIVSTDATGSITAFNIGFMNPTGTNTVGQPMNAIFIDGYQQATFGNPCTTVTAGICTLIPGSGTNFGESETGGTFAIAAPAVSAPMLGRSLLGLLALTLLALVHSTQRRRRI